MIFGKEGRVKGINSNCNRFISDLYSLDMQVWKSGKRQDRSLGYCKISISISGKIGAAVCSRVIPACIANEKDDVL